MGIEMPGKMGMGMIPRDPREWNKNVTNKNHFRTPLTPTISRPNMDLVSFTFAG